MDDALAHSHPSGVIAVRARPAWEGPATFRHGEQDVRVVACPSALAVRAALRERERDGWLVVLTDRPDSDLGGSLLARFTDCKVRRPDPWDAVRSRFAARTLDPALTSAPGHRELAHGLLAATPSAGWPPAPAGSLTRTHALASVARAHLALPPDDVVDAVTVLAWSASPTASARVADLRALAGDAVVTAVLSWLAARSGPAADVLLRLFTSGSLADAVPLGLVLDLLHSSTADSPAAREGMIRLEPLTGGSLPEVAARAWAADATTVAVALVAEGGGQAVLGRADELLDAAQANGLARRSALLRSGLAARLEQLAEHVRSCLPALDAPALDAVERAWIDVRTHRLASGDRRVRVAEAAVRLLRWLALPEDGEATGLAAAVRQHVDIEAHVDVALNDAAAGVGEAVLSDALGRVCVAAQERRQREDRRFAAALAQEGVSVPSPVRGLERLLPDLVLPLARVTPVLLLVLDGMSTGVAVEVLRDITGSGHDWVEVLLQDEPGRSAALAVLPSLTRHSRASLLSGELRSGAQDVERAGHAELLRAAGLTGELLHKKPLEQTPLGSTLAPDVAVALDDVVGKRLVTAVLNTVDDALDRSDPAGTAWDVDAVKHLRPLLERARAAGRSVVLTADHGHVVERRQGTSRPAPGISSGRSRPDDGVVHEDEVRVAGDRVLDHDGRAVLAVDEGLRYGPLKSGYHGGANPAEVVVPVLLLVPGVVPDGLPDGLHLRPAPPQEPSWWWGPAIVPAAAPEPAPATPTLFDEPADVSPAADLAARVLASPAYAEARAAATRVPITDETVRGLLTALLAAPDTRLPLPAIAQVMGEAPARVRGAVSGAQRLLNLEGYPVLSLDPGGSAYVLDAALLREQFEVS